MGSFDYSPWRGAVDLLAGGPPCQPFSGGGLRRGAADERNGWEAALHATQELRPRALLFENVRGMLTPRFDAYRGAISARLTALGYHHDRLALDAADYGVPHHRHPVFLVGVLVGGVVVVVVFVAVAVVVVVELCRQWQL